METLEGFLGRIFGPLLKTGLSLMKNVLKPLDKSASVSLELIAAASPTNAAIQNKIFGSDMHPLDFANQITLIILNEEMDDIMKIVKSLENAGLSIKVVNEAIQNKAKNRKVDFLTCCLVH